SRNLFSFAKSSNEETLRRLDFVKALIQFIWARGDKFMPKVSRRQFLKVGGAAAATLAGSRSAAHAMELERGERDYNYARVAALREPFYTVSPYGKLKSPVEVFVENEEKVVSVAGHPVHIASRGRSKAIDLVSHQALTDPDRLVHPMKRVGNRGEGKWEKIGWEEALAEIAKKMDSALASSRPDAICTVIGEDSGGAGFARFMDTLGSPSTYKLSGDANKKMGQSLTWGEEIETPDFANSKYILNFGSNIFETFEPFAQTVVDGRTDNHAKLVTLDPRMSMTAGKSDEWLPVIPGTDGLVALAMANVIMEEGLADEAFINKWTNITADKLSEHLSQFTLELAEEESGISADDIRRIAIEFAKAGPATVFSYRGASSHTNGVYTERAIMLLPVITGNVELKGGYCLPRKMEWNDLKPVPPKAKDSGYNSGTDFLGELKSGALDIKVLFNYNTNPAYSAVGSARWREALKDEKLVPLFVSIGSFMSETAGLSDIMLPEALFFERYEPVTSPSSLMPWVGARVPVAEAPEDVRELPVILKDIVDALDPDAEKGFARYWDFEDTESLMNSYFEDVPAMKEDGGFAAMEDYSLWPVYGNVDTATGRFVNEDGEAVGASYGLHEKNNGFNTRSRKIEIFSARLKKHGLEPLPTWVKPENHKTDAEDGLIFVTYKTSYQAGSATANNKYLAEKAHSNHCMINKETAHEMGMKDGSLVRLVSPVGYLVTRIRATNAIRPGVVAMAASSGHWAFGSVATADPELKSPWTNGVDPDTRYNLWWRDNGVNPNDIFPVFIDPVGGGASMSFIAQVEPTRSGDRYGEIKLDKKSESAHFRKASEILKG
ncbi:MAG: molybdopterin-dependent oxidoreductase, partial [bacterium]|nr:molybdopterin-dependent oxidoreductase [bacterium]